MFRKTITLDIKEETDSQIEELLSLAKAENYKIYKVQLFRVALSKLYKEVMNSEDKGRALNKIVMEYD